MWALQQARHDSLRPSVRPPHEWLSCYQHMHPDAGPASAELVPRQPEAGGRSHMPCGRRGCHQPQGQPLVSSNRRSTTGSPRFHWPRRQRCFSRLQHPLGDLAIDSPHTPLDRRTDRLSGWQSYQQPQDPPEGLGATARGLPLAHPKSEWPFWLPAKSDLEALFSATGSIRESNSSRSTTARWPFSVAARWRSCQRWQDRPETWRSSLSSTTGRSPSRLA
jgi:hypothetical protein